MVLMSPCMSLALRVCDVPILCLKLASDLVHLPLAHLNWQEDQNESSKPDAAGAEPQNARRSVGAEVASCSVRRYDTGQATET